MFGFFKRAIQDSKMNLDSNTFGNKIKEDKNAVIIDVRTPDEYKSGHIKKAINIDIYESDFKKRIEKLDHSKSYYIYCRSGSRSMGAIKLMKQSGFENICHLSGGINKWKGEIIY